MKILEKKSLKLSLEFFFLNFVKSNAETDKKASSALRTIIYVEQAGLKKRSCKHDSL